MSASELRAPLLLGRYQPDELLGRGGSASVYRARDVLLGRHVAVKVFLGGSEVELERARDELTVLAQVSHHGIVAVLDAGIDRSSPGDPRPFLVMEFLRGDSVRELIYDGRLPIELIGGIAFEVAEALEYIHQRGIIHRDISPSNIVLVDYRVPGARPRARLTDFGLAVQDGWMPPPGDIAEGTVSSLSPEQALRLRLTTASDVYSLGLVLLECFTGVRAFAGKAAEAAMARTQNDPVIPAGVPKPWRRLIAEMTRREPMERPTAAEVLEAVRQILRGSPRRR